MNPLIADDKPMLVLGGIVNPIEVHDTDGKLLGVFVPDGIAQKREEYARALAQHEAEPKEDRDNDDGRTYTTIEVFEHLLTLATAEADRTDLQRHIRQLKNEKLRDQVRELIDDDSFRSQLQELVQRHVEARACASR